VDGREPVEGSTIEIGFDAGNVSTQAGCNTLFGGYSVDDGTLTVATMATTQMACEPELMEQDTWLAEFLTSGPTIELDDSTLTLSGDDVTVVLEEVRPAPLVGTTWEVTGTVAAQGVSSVPAEPTASLVFTDDEVSVDTGCNTGSGGVEIGDDTITFAPIATTLRACVDDVAELEAAVLAVLQGEVAYEIDGDRLSLRTDGPDGEIGLELTAAG
jgi:heat shock protein HslJ